jgi:hypothetical protein
MNQNRRRRRRRSAALPLLLFLLTAGQVATFVLALCFNGWAIEELRR